MRTADWTESVSVLDRVTAVFEAFGEHDEGLGVSELARRANLPKSTVSRIAADLVGQRFLDRDGDKLYLGVRLFELGSDRRAAAAAPPARAPRDDRPAQPRPGRPSISRFSKAADVVFIAIVRGEPDADRRWRRVGGRLPAHATALGKAILAFSPPDVVDAHHVRRPRAAHARTRSANRRRSCASWRRSAGAGSPPSARSARSAAPASPARSSATAPCPSAAISVTGSVDERRTRPGRSGSPRRSASTLSHRIGTRSRTH